VSNYLRVSATSANNSNSSKTTTATCTGGRRVLGGGFTQNGTPNPDIEFVAAYPSSDTVFTVTAVEDSPVNGNWTYTVWAICGTAN
jgi:hypothetical protein